MPTPTTFSQESSGTEAGNYNYKPLGFKISMKINC
jgi:hypothetical protein